MHFSNTASCHYLSVNKFEWKIKPSFDSFTANKIILSRLLTSTLAELVDKSRQEIVKTVIKIMKIISGSLVVYRK